MNPRLKYFSLTIITIVVALAIRKSWAYLPNWINIWIGDFLWAFMLYWAMLMIFLPKNRWRATLYLVVFCWLIEVSQSWHTDWLDTFRNTTFGGLLLGHGFLWSDIIAYTFGCLVGFLFTKYRIIE